ncbi:hypothetical protein QYF36_008757 [Acer negundo]|nr:hypothetical protein QYF36_008757 [Acer negundo]
MADVDPEVVTTAQPTKRTFKKFSFRGVDLDALFGSLLMSLSSSSLHLLAEGFRGMLGDEIGKGAYGRVYKGLDLENGDFVAIKPVSLENIAQEDLNIITNLNHKNIVKYLGSSKKKSHLHIILEYLENGSLANNIKPNKFGPFPESLVAVYFAQVLEGLVYLHEQGVIHRDIKGANILTTKEELFPSQDWSVVPPK